MCGSELKRKFLRNEFQLGKSFLNVSTDMNVDDLNEGQNYFFAGRKKIVSKVRRRRRNSMLFHEIIATDQTHWHVKGAKVCHPSVFSCFLSHVCPRRLSIKVMWANEHVTTVTQHKFDTSFSIVNLSRQRTTEKNMYKTTTTAATDQIAQKNLQ